MELPISILLNILLNNRMFKKKIIYLLFIFDLSSHFFGGLFTLSSLSELSVSERADDSENRTNNKNNVFIYTFWV